MEFRPKLAFMIWFLKSSGFWPLQLIVLKGTPRKDDYRRIPESNEIPLVSVHLPWDLLNFIGDSPSPGIERKEVFLLLFGPPDDVAILILGTSFEVELENDSTPLETQDFEGFDFLFV